MKGKPKRNCLTCNEEFELKSNGPSHAKKKYCSKECSSIGQRKYTDRSWSLECSECGNVTQYSTRENYRRAIRDNRTMCIPCRGKANKGLKRTKEQRKLISERTKEVMHNPEVRNKVLMGLNRPDVKEKLRNSRIEQLGLSPTTSSYNKRACEFFNLLSRTLGWDGQHALYKGEYLIAGYFVDYYEPSLNLVIEWDERYHRLREEKDLSRATTIINKLGCRFLRIDEETLELTEVRI